MSCAKGRHRPRRSPISGKQPGLARQERLRKRAPLPTDAAAKLQRSAPHLAAQLASTAPRLPRLPSSSPSSRQRTQPRRRRPRRCQPRYARITSATAHYRPQDGVIGSVKSNLAIRGDSGNISTTLIPRPHVWVIANY